MSKSASSHPHTAAPTWSGFIYQGHLALYHSIECVLNKMSFELQIDSIDDFSIIENGIAVSTHQVKALADDKRAAYKEALEKAAFTYMLCDKTTKRYFHTSARLDDASDFVGSNGNVVKFYTYDGLPYCYLQDVEEKTKSKIETYLVSEKLPCSDFLVNLKFEALQSHIAAQVIYIHACNQDGLMSAAEAAFTQTLKSEKIVELLSLTATHEDDIVYKMFQAKMAVCKSLYGYTNTMEKTADRTAIQKVANVYDQIKELGDTAFMWLWKSLCFGSSTMVVSENSVYDYVDVIYDIDKAPLSEQKPPYYRCSAGDFYLPTAISADNVRREHRFAEDLMEQLKSDPELIDILVEYQWLIAARANIFSPAERFCAATGASRDAVEDEFSLMGKDRNKITKAFDAKIISKEEARVKLND
ncbi:ABC-three component system protein [Enterobacter hormaechei]|uniref:ABC-three component system protein n=1 Tax=Enterobacter cloacae complex TaxID=354276 RepID=UPI00294A19C0|nr:ABC-three component system protein [Enterobacter hormaechei]MDV5251737.1 hypothetical protein [Enterobacter hormaechei]MDV5400623.1 hypothetical protein [Enterobacter hormaechei]MDV5617211.1 hypothetical protein [Enterobacter hormaechei]